MMKNKILILLLGMTIGLVGCGDSQEIQQTVPVEINTQSQSSEAQGQDGLTEKVEIDIMSDGPEDIGESWENIEQDWNSEEALDNPDEWPGTVYNIEENRLKEMKDYAATHFGKYGGYAQQYLFYYIRGL